VTPPEGPDRSDAARDAVVAAFVLGWHVAELFHANVPGTTQRRLAGVDRLTGIGELDPLSRARLLLAQVRVDLDLAWRFGCSGQEPPDTGPVQALLEAEVRQPGQLRGAVAELHRQLLMALTAADFRLGKAYGLGRALAQTALLPDAKHPETFRRTFDRFRLDNLLGWLADLRSAFPPHAAEAVSGSLQAWAAWSDAPILRPAVDDPGQASARRPRVPPAQPVDWSAGPDRESVIRALHRQGQLWRALLSGERDGLDLLSHRRLPVGGRPVPWPPPPAHRSLPAPLLDHHHRDRGDPGRRPGRDGGRPRGVRGGRGRPGRRRRDRHHLEGRRIGLGQGPHPGATPPVGQRAGRRRGQRGHLAPPGTADCRPDRHPS
jgi:hypothetical protein